MSFLFKGDAYVNSNLHKEGNKYKGLFNDYEVLVDKIEELEGDCIEVELNSSHSVVLPTTAKILVWDTLFEPKMIPVTELTPHDTILFYSPNEREIPPEELPKSYAVTDIRANTVYSDLPPRYNSDTDLTGKIEFLRRINPWDVHISYKVKSRLNVTFGRVSDDFKEEIKYSLLSLGIMTSEYTVLQITENHSLARFCDIIGVRQDYNRADVLGLYTSATENIWKYFQNKVVGVSYDHIPRLAEFLNYGAKYPVKSKKSDCAVIDCRNNYNVMKGTLSEQLYPGIAEIVSKAMEETEGYKALKPDYVIRIVPGRYKKISTRDNRPIVINGFTVQY